MEQGSWLWKVCRLAVRCCFPRYKWFQCHRPIQRPDLIRPIPICCVFWPDFGCCPYPKVCWNTFLNKKFWKQPQKSVLTSFRVSAATESWSKFTTAIIVFPYSLLYTISFIDTSPFLNLSPNKKEMSGNLSKNVNFSYLTSSEWMNEWIYYSGILSEGKLLYNKFLLFIIIICVS